MIVKFINSLKTFCMFYNVQKRLQMFLKTYFISGDIEDATMCSELILK